MITAQLRFNLPQLSRHIIVYTFVLAEVNVVYINLFYALLVSDKTSVCLVEDELTHDQTLRAGTNTDFYLRNTCINFDILGYGCW